MRGDSSSKGTDAPEIPDKLYFRIGEVSQVTGVQPHVLRYWETEFANISPKKAGSGHRLYRRKDVELILEIKRLLYEERFTIEGARKHLNRRGKRKVVKPAPRSRQAKLFDTSDDALTAVRDELKEILRMLGPRS
jgi:DNA-binding transcriptional MerR regulator